MILSVENTKNSMHTHTHKKTLEPTNKYSKVAGKKLTHKNQLYFYILTMNNSQRKLRK